MLFGRGKGVLSNVVVTRASLIQHVPAAPSSSTSRFAGRCWIGENGDLLGTLSRVPYASSRLSMAVSSNEVRQFSSVSSTSNAIIRWQVQAPQEFYRRPSTLAMHPLPALRRKTSSLQHQEPLRCFSSRRDKRKGGGSSSNKMLVNEHVVTELMRRFPQAEGRPSEIEVRLVIDEGPEEPATVQICSLADAIEVSVDRNSDLIGMALQNDPPVIRVAQLSKLEYQQEQAAAKQKAATKSKSKQRKTFRFRAGIDLHDLERKLQDMTKFLEQGMECEYTVFSKARTLRQNANAGMDLVDRIQDLVTHCAVIKRGPVTNETGNHIRVLLTPKKG